MAKTTQGSRRAHYAAPGANDSFLRPPAGHGYAPREIAVRNHDDGAWLAWIHRRDGKEYLVATNKQPDGSGRLGIVDTGRGLFSTPTVLKRPDGATEVICGGAGRRGWEIRSHVPEDDGWVCRRRMATRCLAIHHMDAVSAPDGRAFLVYAGVVEGKTGLQLFSRTSRGGRWSVEEPHPCDGGSVNRPKLAVDGEGRVVMAADVYMDGQFNIHVKTLTGDRRSWTRVSKERDWDLFPSLVADGHGRLWLSWLHETPVRREDVMGMRQEARVARRVGGRWRRVRDGGSDCIADMNLGLLPIKRYFGYDGLRRYPRLLPADSGSLWLLWEQQRDETESWDNLANGYLCGRKYNDGKWDAAAVLLDGGHSFAVDSQCKAGPESAVVAVKSTHRESGDDWIVTTVDLTDPPEYEAPPARLWRGWKRQVLPAGPRDNNRIVCEPTRGKSLNLLWGDLHCHSALSPDAEGEADELFFFGRDLADIDFVCVADNDFYPSKMLLDSDVHLTAEIAESLTETGGFLGLSAFEWTFHRPDKGRPFNHRITIFPKGDRKLVRRNEPGGRSQKAFREYLLDTGHFCFPHHAFWKFLGAPGERAVEVTAAWGTYILDAPTIRDALNGGAKFGFLGNSDSHRFMPGLSGALTGCYAAELARDGVMDALNRRRCFATTGNKTAVAFWINDGFMGQRIATETAPVVRWQVRPQNAIERIDVVRAGEIVYTTEMPEGDWVDEAAPAGESWYYIQVKEVGEHKRYPHNVAPAWGKYAWTSPIWVSR